MKCIAKSDHQQSKLITPRIIFSLTDFFDWVTDLFIFGIESKIGAWGFYSVVAFGILHLHHASKEITGSNLVKGFQRWVRVGGESVVRFSTVCVLKCKYILS